MRIAIRADASAVIGSGHVIRCLSLATALREQGAQVRFLSRAIPAHLADLVRDAGHELAMLDAPGSHEAITAEACWTEPAQRADAGAAMDALADHPAWDWIVVDHYGLGLAWEAAVRPAAHRLLAVDDLGRQHDCDALLDANFMSDGIARYRDKIPATATLMLGPRYALLRPHFLAERSTTQARTGPVRRLLVFLGGMDQGDMTSIVLEAIAFLAHPSIETDVIIGPTHPACARIQALAQTNPLLHCHVQTDRIAQLFAAADLAVGSGGSATWERCAMGLPTLGLCLAENQQAVLEEGARQGFIYVPNRANYSARSIAIHLGALIDNDALRHHISRNGMALVDAQGLPRVTALMLGTAIALRLATMQDSHRLHTWRNDPKVRQNSRNTAEISRAEHEQWLADVLADARRSLLIGERDGQPVGVVRLDTIDASSAELSIYLVPGPQTRGQGLPLLQAAQDWLRQQQPTVSWLYAEVLNDNLPSHRLFSKAGFARRATRYAKRI